MPSSGIALIALIGLIVLVLAGCASTPSPSSAPPAPPPLSTPGATGADTSGDEALDDGLDGADEAASGSIDSSRPPTLLSVLHNQAAKWRGVPYQWGGLSENGVDCSGLVYLIFLSRLGIKMPRTTAGQVRQGRWVARKNLRPGDLVFFRIGRHDRHVGIYLGKGRFLHASVSDGVHVSSLSNAYWRARYWEARRLSLPSGSQLVDSVSSR